MSSKLAASRVGVVLAASLSLSLAQCSSRTDCYLRGYQDREARVAPLPSGTSVLRGKSSRPDGVPLPGVTITLCPESHEYAPRAVVTDIEGRYAVESVPAGRYEFCAELWGFPHHHIAELVIEDGQVLEIDVPLIVEP